MHSIPSLIVSFMIVAAPALAEEGVAAEASGGTSNAITVSPLDLFTGTFNLEYERAVASSLGIYGGVNFLYFDGVLRPGAGTVFAVGPEIGARLYLIGDAPAGLWLGPYLNGAYVRNVSGGVASSSFGYGAGGMAGFNLVLSHFVASVGAGLGYLDYSSSVLGQRVGQFGLTGRLRLAIGVAF